jgi:hypothetical protein
MYSLLRLSVTRVRRPPTRFPLSLWRHYQNPLLFQPLSVQSGPGYYWAKLCLTPTSYNLVLACGLWCRHHCIQITLSLVIQHLCHWPPHSVINLALSCYKLLLAGSYRPVGPLCTMTTDGTCLRETHPPPSPPSLPPRTHLSTYRHTQTATRHPVPPNTHQRNVGNAGQKAYL